MTGGKGNLIGKEEFKNPLSEKEIHGKMITMNNLVSMGNSLLLDKEYELYEVFIREKRIMSKLWNMGILCLRNNFTWTMQFSTVT